jgi:hypothetical protein
MGTEYKYLYNDSTKCMIRECRTFNNNINSYEASQELNIMIDMTNNTITREEIKMDLAVTDSSIFIEFIKNILATDEEMKQFLKQLVINKYYNEMLLTSQCDTSYVPNALFWFH